MRYIYIASTKEGKIKKGFISADSLKAARDFLSNQGLLIISLKKKRKIYLKFPSLSIFFLGGVSTLDKLMFTKHLSVMLKSGVDIIGALKVLKKQTSSSKLKNILRKTIPSVSSGRRLSDSLAEFPDTFSELYINVIRIGEEGGFLDKNLEYLAIQMKKDYDLKRKIKNAMAYPIIVLAAAVAISLSLSVFVLPKITKLFKAFTVPLPLTTRILLWVSGFLGEYGILFVVCLVSLVIISRWFFSRKFIKPYFDQLLLNLPLIGKIRRHINLARFSRVLSSLLKSGLPIINALRITTNTLGDASYQKSLINITDEVQKGARLSSLLQKKEKFFPSLIIQMVDTGERTGRLEETLFYLAEFYEGEVDGAVKNLATIIEPILLILVGIVVGTVALAIISPIYQITGTLGR